MTPTDLRPARSPRRHTCRRTAAWLLLAAAAALADPAGAAPAAVAGHVAERGFAFAVLSGMIDGPADDPGMARMFDAISRDRAVAFAIYDGNLKGAREACRDSVYDNRFAILKAARVPVFYVPGQFDWAACSQKGNGGYDAVERLDYLRQTFLSDSESLGATPQPVTRESEVARFRPFRENIRWTQGDTVFIALNAPSPNNRYLTAGGRNGEFEDRAIANAFWIDHAAEFAKRRNARALVIAIEGDPQFDRYEHERFAWLRLRTRARDGFLEFKRSLVKAAATFRGTILVIHAGSEALRGGFRIDQPLHDEKGERVENLTRIAIAPRERLVQWIKITMNPAGRPMFGVGLQEVPANLPVPPALPAMPHEDVPLPEMPEIPALPELPDPASALGGVPPQPASIGVSPGTAASGAVPPLYPTAPASAPGSYR
ncbi:hypothetical protein G3N92_27335 [Burkholderia sp. Ac-20379]|nr:hypothetical protein [Burkholderia sp. Ac-20379]